MEIVFSLELALFQLWLMNNWLCSPSKSFVHFWRVIPIPLGFGWNSHDGRFLSPCPLDKFFIMPCSCRLALGQTFLKACSCHLSLKPDLSWWHVHVTHPSSQIFSWHTGHVTWILGVDSLVVEGTKSCCGCGWPCHEWQVLFAQFILHCTAFLVYTKLVFLRVLDMEGFSVSIYFPFNIYIFLVSLRKF